MDSMRCTALPFMEEGLEESARYLPSCWMSGGHSMSDRLLGILAATPWPDSKAVQLFCKSPLISPQL